MTVKNPKNSIWRTPEPPQEPPATPEAPGLPGTAPAQGAVPNLLSTELLAVTGRVKIAWDACLVETKKRGVPPEKTVMGLTAKDVRWLLDTLIDFSARAEGLEEWSDTPRAIRAENPNPKWH